MPKQLLLSSGVAQVANSFAHLIEQPGGPGRYPGLSDLLYLFK